MRRGGGNLQRLNSKKGNVLLDSVIFIVVLLIFGIVGVISYITFDEMTDDFVASADISDQAKNMTSDLRDRTPSVLDGAFALMFGLLWLTVLVASFMLDSHPIFFIVSIILLICLLIGSALLTNAYAEFNLDPEYAAYSVLFPITTFVLENMLLFVLIIAATIAIVLFGKNRMG
jgi:hypothetical protein